MSYPGPGGPQPRAKSSASRTRPMTSGVMFIAVNDRDFGIYDCGATFLLWFDGAVFHQF